MAVIVVDSSRPVPATSDNFDNAIDLAEGDMLIQAAGRDSEIDAFGYAAWAINGSIGNTLLINGRVHSEHDSAIGMQGTLSIAASGEVTGSLYGVYLSEDYRFSRDNVVTNAGLISGGSVAVFLDGDRSVISNSGQIIGGYAISVQSTYDHGAHLLLTNTGLIRGIGGIAIEGAFYGPNVITNQGRIEGQIILGTGNDIYDGRGGGTVTGDIVLGNGDDVAFGGDGSETFFTARGIDFVDGGAGIDTLEMTYDTWGLGNSNIDLRNTERQEIAGHSWITIRNVENLVGGAWNDHFEGDDAANVLVGAGSQDILNGNGGNDILNGGTGSDVLSGGEGSDIAVYSGRASDYTIRTGENGRVFITDDRSLGDGSDQLRGVEFALFSDRIVTLPTAGSGIASGGSGEVPSANGAQPSAPAAPLSLKGGRKADILTGGDGDDQLNGGLGHDRLTGGGGKDTFAFTTKLKNNVDLISDFTAADDSFRLLPSLFGKVAKGVLAKEAFHVGARAHDADDRIVYDRKTGALFYDADGSGTAFAAVKFAQLKAKTVVTADDFLII